MAKVRVTNGSEIELNDVVSVVSTGNGYRVAMKNGAVYRYRLVQLTQEAREGFEDMSRFLRKESVS
jgi:hypothetical protein